MGEERVFWGDWGGGGEGGVGGFGEIRNMVGENRMVVDGTEMVDGVVDYG